MCMEYLVVCWPVLFVSVACVLWYYGCHIIPGLATPVTTTTNRECLHLPPPSEASETPIYPAGERNVTTSQHYIAVRRFSIRNPPG